MLTSAFIVLASTVALQGAPAQPAPQPAKVSLSKTMKKGDKFAYKVTSEMVTETRNVTLTTYLPFREGYEYAFTYEVNSVSADGIANAVYKRPVLTYIIGETWDHDEIRQVIKMNYNFGVELSPINELLGMKDLNPKKPEKKEKKEENIFAVRPSSIVQSDFVRQFTSELSRIAQFIGGLDSTLDFAPKLPIRDVKIGDTWKVTVGYAPQRVAGSKNKENAVQRLDFIYRYDGLMESNGKKVQRVSAALEMKSDVAEYIHQVTGLKPSQTGIKNMNIDMKSNVTFDLDPATLVTLRADAVSVGTFAFNAIEVKEQAMEDGKFKADVHMVLTSRK